MAYAAPAYWNESSGGLPNSGRLSGTVGDLVGILDVALVAAGWAIEYTASNARVYRPASGNRFRACFDENTAISGDARLVTFRGAENASAAGSASWIDPFPTVAQLVNNSSTILKSSVASTTARAFDLWVWATGFILAVNVSGSSNLWELSAFGDVDPNITGDVYNTVSMQRGGGSISVVSGAFNSGSTGTTGFTTLHWARSYDGSVKSPFGGVVNPSQLFGVLSSAATARNGPTAGIEAEKAALLDTGNAATGTMATPGLPKRGIFPYLWLPQHGGPGTVNSRDTASLPGGQTFSLVLGQSSSWVMIETDGWSAPSG